MTIYHGYKDILRCKPNCPECHETGWAQLVHDVDFESSHSCGYGKMEPVHVATIEKSTFEVFAGWWLISKALVVSTLHVSPEGAKAAWRRFDGPGTRWRVER